MTFTEEKGTDLKAGAEAHKYGSLFGRGGANMVEERGHNCAVLFGRGDMILPGALKKRRCRKVVS